MSALAVSILSRDIEPLPADTYDISWDATDALLQAKVASKSDDVYLTLHGQRLEGEQVNAPSQPLVLMMELPSDITWVSQVVLACSDFLLTLRDQPSAAPLAGFCTVVYRGEQLELSENAVQGRFTWPGKALRWEEGDVGNWFDNINSEAWPKEDPPSDLSPPASAM